MKNAGKKIGRGCAPHPRPLANWYARMAQQGQLFNPEQYPGKVTPIIDPNTVSNKAKIGDDLLLDLEHLGEMTGWNWETLLNAHGVEYEIIELKGEKYVRFEYGSIYIMDPTNCDPEEAHEWLNNVDDPFLFIDMGDFAQEYWDGVSPDTVVYHGTVGENVESIRQEGLAPMCNTRGISNRGTGCAVFATESPELAESYTYPDGIVIEILVGAMKVAGITLPVSQEDPINEYEAYMALAHKIGLDEYSRDVESGIDPETIIFYGHIPPQFLRIPTQKGASWYRRLKYAITIEPFDYENTIPEDVDYDLNQRMDQAEMVFQKSKIRYDSTKNISHVAIEDGQVIGAVASGWSRSADGNQEIWVYDFDTAVDPAHRNYGMAGFKLISQAVQYYEQTKGEYQEQGFPTMMRVWVVNKRLVPILEAKFNFTIESQHSNGSAHMVRY